MQQGSATCFEAPFLMSLLNVVCSSRKPGSVPIHRLFEWCGLVDDCEVGTLVSKLGCQVLDSML
jgi:hypothetical protein